MKQTAVEFLVQQINSFNIGDLRFQLLDAITQAKEIEKKQIIDAWEDGQNSFPTRTPKQYYNETFKNK